MEEDKKKKESWMAPRQATLEGKLRPQTQFRVTGGIRGKKPKYLKKYLEKPKPVKKRTLDYFAEIREPTRPRLEEYGEVCGELERRGIADEMKSIMQGRILHTTALPIYEDFRVGKVVEGTVHNVDLPQSEGSFIVYPEHREDFTEEDKLEIFAEGNRFACIGIREKHPRIECVSFPRSVEWEKLHREAKEVKEFFDMFRELPPETRRWYQDKMAEMMWRRRELLRNIDDFIEKYGRRCVID